MHPFNTQMLIPSVTWVVDWKIHPGTTTANEVGGTSGCGFDHAEGLIRGLLLPRP